MEHSSTDISLGRAALISFGVAAFLLIFRPFGMALANPAEVLAVLGFAPLNFFMILAVHRLPTRGRRFGMLISTGAIILANAVYVTLLSSDAVIASTFIKTGLVALLAVAAIGLWNRERALQRKLIAIEKAAPLGRPEIIVLRGENDRDILRAPPEALLFVEANGNYVNVRHRVNGETRETLLRATLSAVEEQAPAGSLVRCHRSYLVNLSAARHVVRQGGKMTIAFEHGPEVPVSRAYRDAVRAAAKQ